MTSALTLPYAFHDPSLVAAALSHPSYAGSFSRAEAKIASRTYERMEFLGDRILGLVVAEWLYRLYPSDTEGALAKRMAHLVGRATLARVARGWGIDRALRTAGLDADKTSDTVLADATEAMVAALYLDGGLDVVRDLLCAALQPYRDDNPADNDPKTVLQEWAQKHCGAPPVYRVTHKTGSDHAPLFTIEVSIKGYPPMEATGSSRRGAEKNAAAALWAHIKKR